MRLGRFGVSYRAAAGVALVAGCLVGALSGCDSGTSPAGRPRPAAKAEKEAAAAPTSALVGVTARLIERLAEEDDRDETVAALAALGEPAIPGLADALDEPDAEVRIAVVDALEEIGSPAVVEHLLSALADEDEEVRLEAVEALAAVPDRRSVKPLLERYAVEPESAVRYEILTALGPIGDPGTVEFLAGETSSSDRYVRMWAMDALCVMSSSKAPDLAVSLLRDPDENVRRHVLGVCRRVLNRADGWQALISVALHSDSFNDASSARYNLQRFLTTPDGRPGARDQLREQIRTAAKPLLQGDKALNAALLLAEIDDPSGVPVFLASAEDPRALVRQQVAAQLGRYGGPDAVPVLIKLSRDESQVVAMSATQALTAFARQGDPRAKRSIAELQASKKNPK